MNCLSMLLCQTLRMTIGACLAVVCVATQAQATPSPVGEWIDTLSESTQADSSDVWTVQHAAETAVAHRIRDLIASRPGDPELTQADRNGRTPLIRAALWGYAEVVEALLSDTRVKDTIDARSPDGLSAWMASQYARPLTLAACHPQILIREAVGVWGPHLRRMAYFSRESPNAFDRIRYALARAGAKPDIDAAKRFWLSSCPGHDPALEPALTASEDIMATLIADSRPRLEALFAEIRQPPKLVKRQPPQPVLRRGSSERPGASASRNPRLVCSKMPLPDRESIGGSRAHTTLFRVIAEVQDGVPAAAAIENLSPDPTNSADEIMRLRAAVYAALGEYRCPGDHVFEQEFQFVFN